MLTIKVIGIDGGEHVEEVRCVCMHPDENARMIQEMVYYFVPGEVSARDVRYGDVYVMNENGKTIADYHLSKQPKTSAQLNVEKQIKDKVNADLAEIEKEKAK